AFSTINSSLEELSRITGLRPKHEIKHDLIKRSELKQFLEDRIEEEIDPKEVQAEELALKKFGFVPQDFNLIKTTVDLMTEQAAAFYDYRKKKLFLLEGASAVEHQTVLVHELAHALADQHFNLGKFLRRGKNDDATLARMAVMEGQATWLMYELMAQRMGQSLKEAAWMIDRMNDASDSVSESYPVLRGAPLYLKASLLFPYKQGLQFHQSIVEKMGSKAFAEVFRNPPATTQQVLHPEKYLHELKPTVPELPLVPGASRYSTLIEGTLGEFDHSVLLEQYLSKDESRQLAPKWRGGVFELLEHKKNKRSVLRYASIWEDRESAEKMFAAYKAILKGKWKNMRIAAETGDSLSGEGDDGYFYLRLAGTTVSSVEGLESRE
ncbi:MAG: hypothetical protein ACRD7E_09025, partial [Bryobacteraceae bacterium]